MACHLAESPPTVRSAARIKNAWPPALSEGWLEGDEDVESLTPEQLDRFIAELEGRMREAARKFEFVKAAQLRDRVKALKTAAAG